MRYPSTIDSDFDAERSENDQGSSESPFGNHLERETPILAGMTQTTNIRSVWLPGEINGSRKDSPTAPVTYHPDRITAESVSSRAGRCNVCAPVHKRRKEKVEDMRAAAPTRLNLAHVRRRVAGLYLRNVPREHPEKLFG